MGAFRTPAAMGAGIAGLLLFVSALVLGRPDVALAGVVLIAAVAIAWRRPPSRAPQVVLTPLPGTGSRDAASGSGAGAERDGGDARRATDVRVDLVAVDADLVRLVVTALGVDVHRLTVAGSAQLTVRLPRVHSGVHEVLAVSAAAVGAEGAWASRPTEPVVLTLADEPVAMPVPFLPVPRMLTGLSGGHEASRPGDGGEFLEVRPFVAGDRLRRIDWKATARLGRLPGELFARKTYATSETTIAIVVDDGDDLSGLTGDWLIGDPALDTPRSLDLAREAAWSLASAYLDGGDQVALHVLSRAASTVPRGSGARQRERLRTAIVRIAAGSRFVRDRAPRVAAGALVVVLSTFLDDRVVWLVDLWRAAGHRVLAVDTLPRRRSERLTREMALASRIVLAEREDRLSAIRATGAEVLVWDAAAGERAAALRGFARARRRR